MPVGIPQLPFRFPGEEEEEWIDIYNCLYRKRFLFLGQEVNDEISNQLVGMMVYLNAEDPSQDMHMFINSPGGSVIGGIAIHDMMQSVSAVVHTNAMGLAASAACIILTGGQITKRMAFPHARIMIHQPVSSYYDGQAGECIMEIEEVIQLRDSLTKMYMEITGKPLWVISEDLDRDIFMSPEEAILYGLIDDIASNE